MPIRPAQPPRHNPSTRTTSRFQDTTIGVPAGAEVLTWRTLLTREPRRPRRIRDSRHAPLLVVVTVCLGSFLGQLDASIVTVALPDLRGDLGISLGAATWVSLAYLVMLVGMVAPLGRLADVVGRKLLYTDGFAVFTVASFGAAVAPNFELLVLCRAVQGLGAAMLQANSVALIATTVPRERLGRALGAHGAAQAIGLSLGPVVGGLLIELGGWRWVFYANLPAGVIGIALGVALLPRTRHRSDPVPFDWTGLALLVPLVTAVMLTLSLAGGGMVGSGAGRLVMVAAGAVVVGVLGIALVRVERRAPGAVVNLDLLRRPDVGPGLGAGLVAFLVMFGLLLAVPQALADTGSSTGHLTSSLLIAVLPIAFGLAAPLSGRLVERRGSRATAVAGLVLAAVGLLAAAVGGDGPGVLVVALVLAGGGLGIFVPANNTAIMSSVAPQVSGMASGMLNMARGLGTAFGVAVATLAYQIGGFVTVMICLAGLALGGAGLAAARSAPAARPA